MINTEKVKDRIHEKNLTQQYVATTLGISTATINRKINNAAPMTLDEVESLASVLEIPDCEFGIYFFKSITA